jgi:hypothetical protein
LLAALIVYFSPSALPRHGGNGPLGLLVVLSPLIGIFIATLAA